MRREDIKLAGSTIRFLQGGKSDTEDLMSGPYGFTRAATTDHDPISDLAQSIDDNLSAGIRLVVASIRRWEREVEQSITQIMGLEAQLAN